MLRRHTLLAALLAVIPIAGLAQANYPGDKPVTVILPFAAGSGTDVMGRALLAGMTAQMKGVTFVIDNKPGANGIIAATAAAKSAPDGYTLFFTTNTTHSVNPVIYKKLPYDPNTDFAPVGLLMETAPALLAAANSPANSLKDVVEMAKKKAGGLNFATANTSSLAATQMFQRMTGANLAIANYKATPQALTDLAGGTLDFFFGDLASSGALVRGGKLKALAVLSDRRLPGFPQVPTVAEAGFPGLEIPIWGGLFAPRGTPVAIVEQLNKAMVAAEKDPELIKAVEAAAGNVRATSTAAFTTYVAEQYARWAKLAKDINLQAE
jgi:tripartite-type tricarboxylate transporter receptor subunit TctC